MGLIQHLQWEEQPPIFDDYIPEAGKSDLDWYSQDLVENWKEPPVLSGTPQKWQQEPPVLSAVPNQFIEQDPWSLPSSGRILVQNKQWSHPSSNQRVKLF